MTRIVVIGGVAAGMSAASQAKRRSPESEVIVLERGEHVSYGACGMPYNIEDPERSIDDLVVMSADTFRSKRGIDVRTRHEVLSIDPAGKTLTIWDLADDREYSQPWDRLIIATGARAFRPSIPGLDLAGVFPLRALSDGAAIKEFLELQQPRRAAIVGAGFIGMEMSEALRLRGLDVVILEREDQVLPDSKSSSSRSGAAASVRMTSPASTRSRWCQNSDAKGTVRRARRRSPAWYSLSAEASDCSAYRWWARRRWPCVSTSSRRPCKPV